MSIITIRSDCDDEELADIMRAAPDEQLARIFRSLSIETQVAMAIEHEKHQAPRVKVREPARIIPREAVLASLAPGSTRTTVALGQELGGDCTAALKALEKEGVIRRPADGGRAWYRPQTEEARDG